MAQLYDAPPKRWRVCERCLPLPGDAVTCTFDGSKPEGTLHNSNYECLNMRRDVAAGGRLIRPTPALMEQYSAKLAGLVKRQVGLPAAQGRAGCEEALTTKVIVFTRDRPGVLLTVSSVVTAETLNIVDVVSKTEEVGTASAFSIRSSSVPMTTCRCSAASSRSSRPSTTSSLSSAPTWRT